LLLLNLPSKGKKKILLSKTNKNLPARTQVLSCFHNLNFTSFGRTVLKQYSIIYFKCTRRLR
jgi:hypothetical protein